MTKESYDVREARENLPGILEKVASGAEVIIAKEGRPLVRMSRIEDKGGIRFGVVKGKAKVADDFDVPWAEELLSEFDPNSPGGAVSLKKVDSRQRHRSVR